MGARGGGGSRGGGFRGKSISMSRTLLSNTNKEYEATFNGKVYFNKPTKSGMKAYVRTYNPNRIQSVKAAAKFINSLKSAGYTNQSI